MKYQNIIKKGETFWYYKMRHLLHKIQQLFHEKACPIVKVDIKQVTIFFPVSSVTSHNFNMVKTSSNRQPLLDNFSFWIYNSFAYYQKQNYFCIMLSKWYFTYALSPLIFFFPKNRYTFFTSASITCFYMKTT